MAAETEIELRLMRWAEWVTVGDGSGYPSVCTLHANWSPPQAGQRPAMKVAPASHVHATHRAIARLPLKLRNAVVARYIYRGDVGSQALLMGCEPETVRQRVRRAHDQLACLLSEALPASVGEFCNKPVVG